MRPATISVFVLIVLTAATACAGAPVVVPTSKPESSSTALPTASAAASPSAEATTTASAGAVTSPSASSAQASSSASATRQGWILLDHEGANGLDKSPSVDPDGRSLWLVRADGTELHELLRNVPKDGKINPNWSRDGSHITFESLNPRTLIWETDPTGSGPELVSVGCSGLGETCVEGQPAYSPDGNRIAFVTTTDNFVTGTIGIRDRCTPESSCAPGAAFGSAVSTIESTRVSLAGLDTPGVAWSPDGKLLAYYRIAHDGDGKPNGTSDLWVLGVDGTNLHKVPLPAGMRVGDPDWSPDSSELVFSTYPIHDFADNGVASDPDVYTVRPDGSELKRLTTDGGGAPTWTSDGLILYQAANTMWLMNADGTQKARVFSARPVIWGDATGWSFYGYWQPQA